MMCTCTVHSRSLSVSLCLYLSDIHSLLPGLRRDAIDSLPIRLSQARVVKFKWPLATTPTIADAAGNLLLDAMRTFVVRFMPPLWW